MAGPGRPGPKTRAPNCTPAWSPLPGLPQLHPCLEPPAVSRLPQPQAPGSEARTNHGLPTGSPVTLHQPALVPGCDGPEGTPHLYVTSPRVFETLQNMLDSWLPATKIRTKF